MRRPAELEIRLGCAGWTIPRPAAGRFPAGGSHLERYAARFSAVEIDSSFYRQHRAATYARWSGQVPDSFRFAVKMPRQITHAARLADPVLLDGFLPGVLALGARLGPLVVQLPPSLAFDRERAAGFFLALRARFRGGVVCEPRQAGWFSPEAERLLAELEVARAAADPACVPQAAEPGGWPGLVYYRLHGSPRRYYSAYSPDYLRDLAGKLLAACRSAPVWCILDNTAAGAATGDALALSGLLAAPSAP